MAPQFVKYKSDTMAGMVLNGPSSYLSHFMAKVSYFQNAFLLPLSIFPDNNWKEAWE